MRSLIIELAWSLDGGRCYYGGRQLRKYNYGIRIATGWELDHAVPRVLGGANNNDNLVVACWACNRFKATMTHDEWQDIIDTVYGGRCPHWRYGHPVKKH